MIRAIGETRRLLFLVAVGVERKSHGILIAVIAKPHQAPRIRTRFSVSIDVTQRPSEPHVNPVILAGIILSGVLQNPGPNSVLDRRLRFLSAAVRAVHPIGHVLSSRSAVYNNRSCSSSLKPTCASCFRWRKPSN